MKGDSPGIGPVEEMAARDGTAVGSGGEGVLVTRVAATKPEMENRPSTAGLIPGSPGTNTEPTLAVSSELKWYAQAVKRRLRPEEGSSVQGKRTSRGWGRAWTGSRRTASTMFSPALPSLRL